MRARVAMVLLVALGAGGVAAWSGWRATERAREIGRVHAARWALPTVGPEEAARALSAMTLVTVRIQSVVEVERGDESWRGSVVASVRSPVVLSYGTDLSGLATSGRGVSGLGVSGRGVSGLGVSAVRVSPGRGVWIVRVPRPRLVSVEVLPGEQFGVDVGWLRLRSRAGEYYLGLARRDVLEAARGLQLREEDQRRVEEMTRERVAELVRRIVMGGDRAGGDRAGGDEGPTVIVRFDDAIEMGGGEGLP